MNGNRSLDLIFSRENTPNIKKIHLLKTFGFFIEKMKLLTVKQVSGLIQARPSTIYQWAELGQIPSYKVNGLLRFSEEEVLKWLEGCKSPAPELSYSGAGRRPGKGGCR